MSPRLFIFFLFVLVFRGERKRKRERERAHVEKKTPMQRKDELDYSTKGGLLNPHESYRTEVTKKKG